MLIKTHWNKTAEETYKIKKEYILGKKIGEHFRDESIVLHRILNEGRLVRGQYHRPDKDTHVLINASPIIIENTMIGQETSVSLETRLNGWFSLMINQLLRMEHLPENIKSKLIAKQTIGQ